MQGHPHGDAGPNAQFTQPSTLYSAHDLELDLRLWAAANYLTVGQMYMRDNALLRRPLQHSDIKPRLLGHWGTNPGLAPAQDCRRSMCS